jgi:hypothetical protein
MSGLAMWLRALPGRRWLPLGLALLAVLSLALGHLAGSGRPAAGDASSPVAGEPDGGPMAVPETPTRTAAPSPDAATVAAAAEVARAFAVAYGSYRFDDAAEALRQRQRPYDSDAFDASLGQGGGAGIRPQAAARHEVAVASVQQVRVTGLAPDGRLVVVALVSQTLHSDAGDSASSRYLELFLTETAGGWRVDEVMA